MEKTAESKGEKLFLSFFMKIMKIYLTLFIVGSLSSLSAVNTYSQSANVSMKLSNATLEELFSAIESKTTYVVLYKKGLTDNKTVSVDTEDKSVDEILNSVLPALNLEYHINGKQIVVAEKESVKDISQSPATYTLNGVVTDNTGEPLIGVPVSVKGTTTGVMTDDNGKFSLKISNGFTLLFKYIGYKETEILITGQQDLKITLYEDVTQLKDVVVVGYGTQKKASVVGSVQSVSPGELRVPSTQLTSSFAGRLAGVVAVQRSGEPGANGADFWIRGISTFGAIKSPLIVIDGVEASSGDLNNLDPEIIDSFSILKDATATALYGTRGANGVMIVTTKGGLNIDKPIISARVETSITSPTKKPKIVDGSTYMSMYNEALAGGVRGTGVPYSAEKMDGTMVGIDPLLYPNVDWYKEMFNNTAMTQKASLNIRGGGPKLIYFMNVSANHESGLLKNRSKEFYSFDNNIDIWRYNFQNNIGINASPTTTINLRLNTQLYDYNGPKRSANDLYGLVMNTNGVDFPTLFPANDRRNISATNPGHYMFGGKLGGTNNSGYQNPLAEMTNGINSRFESTVMANLELNQKLDFIVSGLSFNGLVSFKNWTSSQKTRSVDYNTYYIDNYSLNANGGLNDYTLQRVGDVRSPSLSTEAKTYGDRRFYIETRLHYDKTFNKVHSVSAMINYNQDEYNNNNPARAQEDDKDNKTALLYSSLARRRQGLAGRLSYAFDNRYMAEVNFGYNGSENFAEGHRFGFFPSFALGYNISEEDYWTNIKPIVSHLKVRGSWGLVGNDSNGSNANQRFLYLGMIDKDGKDRDFTTGVEQGTTLTGPRYKRMYNPNISWEVGEKINVGIDIQFANDYNIVLDVFREIRRDIFLERQTIPNYVGTADIVSYGNLGKVRNHGFDFSFDYNKQIGKDLFVSFKGTLTYAANKILAYDEPMFVLYPNKSRVGYSVDQLSMYMAERLFIDDAEVANSPRQQLGGYISGGDIKYTDQPNRYGETDGVIDESDMLYNGHPTTPEIVYGFGPSIQWKEWDFSLFFQGVGRTSLMMSGFHPFGTASIRNVLQFVADDYWSEANPNIYASYPRLSQSNNNNNTANSSYWLRDASFLKLKNAEIGYTHRFMNTRSFRVYLSGTNLLTFSKFKYWDPEQGGGAGFKYPTTRVFNLGVSVSL